VAVLQEVPTVAESGIAGYESALWISFVAPAATPASIVTRLNREVNEILASADTKEALAGQGLDAEPGAPQALTERIRIDTDKWRRIIAQAGIRAE